MTHITRPLLILAVRVIAVHGSATIDKRQEEDPPLQKCEGGHPPRGRPVPSSHCHPPRPSSPPAPGAPSGSRSLDHRRCCPPPPPACVDFRPPRRVPPGLNGSTSSSSPPGIPQASSPPPSPSPPHGNNNAYDQRSVEATRKQSPEYDKPRASQYVSSSSLPPRVGGGRGEGCRTQRPVAPGIAQPISQYLRMVVSLSSSSSSGARRGGAPAAPVAGRGGSNRRGSSGGDNDMFCCGMWSDWFGGSVNYMLSVITRA
jgi:hypothetical protein